MRGKPGHIQKYARWKLLVPKLPSVSGRKIIRSLNRLGFIIVRQRGSHVFMQREDATVTVPLNDPVKKTTLTSILNQAGVSLE
jgi:predicted RNA binding protein YcfA (HicA-like mRNA interferase family)